MMEGKSTEAYSDELKSFALTLNFYSAKAYIYVREKVGKENLPCPDSIRRWYSHISGSPGFIKEAFTGLTMKAEEAKKKE